MEKVLVMSKKKCDASHENVDVGSAMNHISLDHNCFVPKSSPTVTLSCFPNVELLC